MGGIMGQDHRDKIIQSELVVGWSEAIRRKSEQTLFNPFLV